MTVQDIVLLAVLVAAFSWAIYRYWWIRDETHEEELPKESDAEKIDEIQNESKVTRMSLIHVPVVRTEEAVRRLEQDISETYQTKTMNICPMTPELYSGGMRGMFLEGCLNVAVIKTSFVLRPLEFVLDYLINYTKHEYNVLGFNCERIPYINSYTKNKNIVLLQLCTDDGFCAIFRLSTMDFIYKSLKELLEDKSIIKVGVDPSLEQKTFLSEFSVRINGLVNIKSLAEKAGIQNDELIEKFNEGSQYGRSFTDWEAVDLEEHQISLASQKPFRNIKIFKLLASFLYDLPGDGLLNFKSLDLIKEFIDVEEDPLLTLEAYRAPNYIDMSSIYGRAMPGLNVLIPKTAKECDDILKLIQKNTHFWNFIGFDCEWLPTFRAGETRKKIELVQLCLSEQYCVLIRLSKMDKVPKVLKEILMDPKILKLGIVPEKDAKFLKEDYQIIVKGTLDLRHIAEICGYPPRKLDIMAKSILNIDFDKSNMFSLMKWDVETLNPKQIEYAAMDVYTSLKIFHKLNEILQTRNKHVLRVHPVSFANKVYVYHPTKYLTQNIHNLSVSSPSQPRPNARKTKVARNKVLNN